MLISTSDEQNDRIIAKLKLNSSNRWFEIILLVFLFEFVESVMMGYYCCESVINRNIDICSDSL